jgi:hypothetical protein
MPRQSFRIMLYKYEGPVQVRVQKRVVTGVTSDGFKFALGMPMAEFTSWLQRRKIWYHHYGFNKRRDDHFIEK